MQTHAFAYMPMYMRVHAHHIQAFVQSILHNTDTNIERRAHLLMRGKHTRVHTYHIKYKHVHAKTCTHHEKMWPSQTHVLLNAPAFITQRQ